MFQRRSDRNGPLAVTVREGHWPTLLLLHGLTGSSTSWVRLARLLSGYRLVIRDLLGFGRSPEPDSLYDLDDRCGALAPLIAEARSVAVVGHSMEVSRARTGSAACGHRYWSAPLPRTLRVARASAGGYRARTSPPEDEPVFAPPRPRRLRGLVHAPPAPAPCGPAVRSRPPRRRREGGTRPHLAVYSRTLDRIVLGGVGGQLMGEVGERVAIVHAKADRTVPLPVLEPIMPLVGRFALVDGDHLALLKQPESVASGSDRVHTGKRIALRLPRAMASRP